MPVYEYKCTVCEQHFDIEQSFSDDTLTIRPGCEVDGGGLCQLKKVFSAVGISFKGDGFYRNDSRGSSKSSTAPGSSSSSSNSDSSSSSSTDGNGSSSSSSSDSSSGSASSQSNSSSSPSSSSSSSGD